MLGARRPLLVARARERASKRRITRRVASPFLSLSSPSPISVRLFPPRRSSAPRVSQAQYIGLLLCPDEPRGGRGSSRNASLALCSKPTFSPSSLSSSQHPRPQQLFLSQPTSPLYLSHYELVSYDLSEAGFKLESTLTPHLPLPPLSAIVLEPPTPLEMRRVEMLSIRVSTCSSRSPDTLSEFYKAKKTEPLPSSPLL